MVVNIYIISSSFFPFSIKNIIAFIRQYKTIDGDMFFPFIILLLLLSAKKEKSFLKLRHSKKKTILKNKKYTPGKNEKNILKKYCAPLLFFTRSKKTRFFEIFRIKK